MKRLSKIIIFICILLIPSYAKAKEPDYITFNTNIQVNKHRVLMVEENYYIYFDEEKKEYIRKFPLKSTILTSNNEEIVKSKYTDFNVIGQKFTTKSKNKQIVLTVPTSYAQNQVVNFNVKYNYWYQATQTNKSQLYFDIVNPLHEGSVSNINFSVTLPEAVKQEQITFWKGNENITTSTSFYIMGTTISGFINDMINPNESFSIQIDVGDSYFITDSIESSSIWSLFIPFLSLLLSMGIWTYYQKRKRKTSSAIFNPPHHFDCAEIAYLYHGYTSKSDLATLILQLANQGYLEVIERDQIQLVKVKEYDRNNAAEKIIFEALFRQSNIVSLNDLNSLHDTFEEAKIVLDNEEHQEQIFVQRKKSPILFLFVLFLSGCSILWTPSLNLLGNSFWAILFSILFSIGFFLFFMIELKTLPKSLLGLVFLFPSIYVGIGANIGNTQDLILFLVGLILTGSLMIGYRILPKRSAYGEKMLEEIMAFRSTLLHISSLNLQEMEQSESYFYHILPYAYVLGIYDVWIEKGKDIVLDLPTWYHGNRTTIQEFYVFYRSCIQNMTKEIMTLPTSTIKYQSFIQKIEE